MSSSTSGIWKQKIRQYVVAMLAANPFFTYATQIAWISSAIPILKSNSTITNEPLTDETISWMASVMAGTAIPSAILIGFMAEICGRKHSLIIIAVPQALCWAIKIFTVNPGFLILARFLAGMSAGTVYGLIIMYYKEISDVESRGIFTAFAVLMSKLGVLVANITGTYLDYYTNLYLLICFPLFHIIAFSAFGPESPAYLLHVGRREEAIRIIAWLRNMTPEDEKVKKVVKELEMEHRQMKDVNRLNLRAVFKDKATWEAFKVIMGLQWGLNWCGTYVIVVYASSVLERTESVMSPNEQAIVLASILCFGSFFTANLLESLGRRGLCFLGLGITAAGMVIIGIWNELIDKGIYASSWIPLIAAGACLFTYTAGGLSLLLVLKMEMFNYRVRMVMASLAMASSWLQFFVALKLFHPITAYCGRSTPFFLFAAFNIITFIYMYYALPETRGKTLEMIQKELVYGRHYKEPVLPEENKALEPLKRCTRDVNICDC